MLAVNRTFNSEVKSAKTFASDTSNPAVTPSRITEITTGSGRQLEGSGFQDRADSCLGETAVQIDSRVIQS
ncbi:hypothetical protein OG21DRAFT_1517089 [Imleria badia]|nr:hypothetical protein OG21DRAFT_1517089 [Imleria badia]